MVRYRRNGAQHELRCDFIAGRDGYHGVTRASVPAGAITTYEKVYPFGWLGILAPAGRCVQGTERSVQSRSKMRQAIDFK